MDSHTTRRMVGSINQIPVHRDPLHPCNWPFYLSIGVSMIGTVAVVSTGPTRVVAFMQAELNSGGFRSACISRWKQMVIVEYAIFRRYGPL